MITDKPEVLNFLNVKDTFKKTSFGLCRLRIETAVMMFSWSPIILILLIQYWVLAIFKTRDNFYYIIYQQ